MSEPLARLYRLLPDYDGPSRYTGRLSQARQDPQARAAVDLRRDVIDTALRVAGPEATTFRIAADLQRLIVSKVGVITASDRRDGSGPILTSSRAMGINAAIALEIDEALGEGVLLLKRREALKRLAAEGERRHVVLAPDRRTTRDLAARVGVEAVLAGVWIAAMDSALTDLESPAPLWRYCNGRTVLVDRAWILPNVDVLLILDFAAGSASI